MTQMGKWIDDLVNSTDKFVRMETTDGVIREGRISGYRTRKFLYNGVEELLPTEVELNGDPSDTVPLDRVVKIDIG